MEKRINNYLDTISKCFGELKNESESIQNAVNLITLTLKSNKKLIFCGNGGSASDAQHLAAEFIGRYKENRSSLAAIAITTDTSAITAIGNDYGFDNIFSRQIEGIGVEGDTLIAISTSGNSVNILEAIKKAKKMNIKIIGLTGNKNKDFSNLVDICINVPSSETNHIQEMHIAVGQLICELVEKEIF